MGASTVGFRAVTTVADSKDWPWVLERPCPECGLDSQSFAREAVAGMIRANAQAWQGALAEDGLGNVRRHPSPGVWSALEYGCHVRDLLPLYDERLGLIPTLRQPPPAHRDQDAPAL